jgi:hypothetical protein
MTTHSTPTTTALHTTAAAPTRAHDQQRPQSPALLPPPPAVRRIAPPKRGSVLQHSIDVAALAHTDTPSGHPLTSIKPTAMYNLARNIATADPLEGAGRRV